MRYSEHTQQQHYINYFALSWIKSKIVCWVKYECKIHFDCVERSERVRGKKKSPTLCGENGGAIFGGGVKTTVTLF